MTDDRRQTTDHGPQKKEPGARGQVQGLERSSLEPGTWPLEPAPAVGGRRPVVVAVVGPCACGKSTLVAALRAAGYEARHPAQEHSYVPDMWRRLVDPDVLIYLDLSYETYIARRPHGDLGRGYIDEQKRRLGHARAHADLVVDTSELTVEGVWAAVADFLADIPSKR